MAAGRISVHLSETSLSPGKGAWQDESWCPRGWLGTAQPGMWAWGSLCSSAMQAQGWHGAWPAPRYSPPCSPRAALPHGHHPSQRASGGTGDSRSTTRHFDTPKPSNAAVAALFQGGLQSWSTGPVQHSVACMQSPQNCAIHPPGRRQLLCKFMVAAALCGSRHRCGAVQSVVLLRASEEWVVREILLAELLAAAPTPLSAAWEQSQPLRPGAEEDPMAHAASYKYCSDVLGQADCSRPVPAHAWSNLTAAEGGGGSILAAATPSRHSPPERSFGAPSATRRCAGAARGESLLPQRRPLEFPHPAFIAHCINPFLAFKHRRSCNLLCPTAFWKKA